MGSESVHMSILFYFFQSESSVLVSTLTLKSILSHAQVYKKSEAFALNLL